MAEAVVGTLRALLTLDTAKFEAGAQKSVSSTVKLEKALSGLGAQAARLTPQAERMVKALGGDKLLAQANNLTAAVQKIGGAAGIAGGAATLTEAQQARVNRTLADAIAKYKALGQQAPRDLLNLEKSTRGVATATSGLSASLNQANRVLNLFGASLSVGAFIAFGRQILVMADDLARVADRTGLTTTEVQKLQFIARQSGNSVDELTSAIGSLQNRLVEGDKNAINAVKVLGLNLAALRAASPLEQLAQIGESLSKIPDPAARTALAIDLIGRTGAAVLPTLIADFKRLGDQAPLMSDRTVRALDQAGDSLFRFQQQVKVWAAELYNFLGRAFDLLVIGVRRSAAFLSDQLGNVADLLGRLPLGGEFALLGKKLHADAQLLRDAADATASALNRQETEVRKAASAIFDYDQLNKTVDKSLTWIEENRIALIRLNLALKDAEKAGVPLSVVIKEFGNQIDEAVVKARIFRQTVPPAVMEAAAAIGLLDENLRKMPQLDLDDMGLRAVPDAIAAWQKVFDAIDDRQQQSLARRQQGILSARQFEIDFAKSRGATEKRLFQLTEQLERSRLDVELGAEMARFEIQSRGIDKTTELYKQLERVHQDTVNHLNQQWEIGVHRRAALFETDAMKLVKGVRGHLSQLEQSTVGSLATILFGDRGDTSQAQAEIERLENAYKRLKDSGTASAEALTKAFRSWQDAVDQQNEGLVSRWQSVWDAIKRTTLSILDDVLSYFTKQFIGGLIRGIAGARLGERLGSAIGGGTMSVAAGIGSNVAGAVLSGGGSWAASQVAGVEAAALGGGSAAAASGGGTAAAAGIGVSATTIAATAGIAAGAIALYWGIKHKGLFRGGEEALKVNPRRDQFLSQFGDVGNKGVGGAGHNLAAMLTAFTGVPSGGPSFLALQRADTVKEFEAAQQSIVSVLMRFGKRVRSFNLGGWVPPGVTQLALLHGGMYGESIRPDGPRGPSMGRAVNVNLYIQAWDGEDVARTIRSGRIRSELIGVVKNAFTFNHDELVTHTQRVLAR